MSATLTFSWSKPLSLASCTDCSFEYKYALSSVSLSGITPTPVSFGTLSVTIPGLVNGESYHYAVRTICGPVQSKWSYGTTVVCDTQPIDTPTPTPTATPTPTPTAVPGQTPTPTPTPTVVVQTPTPTPTPTEAVQTPTPTPTTGGCYQYVYGPAQAGCTIYWTTCLGVPQSTFVSVGEYYTVGCAQIGTLSGCGQFTQGVSCGSTSPTPTPTPTPTAASGECYTYQVDYSVSQSNYGIRYTAPGQSSQDYTFNQMIALDGGSYIEFNICSTVEPTLLDYTQGYAMGVGSINGVSRTGPNGSCSSTLDCGSMSQTPTPTPTTPSGGFVSETYGCVNGQCTQGVGNYATYAECCGQCAGCVDNGGCPTPDMLMMIEDGWIKAGNLNIGDMVYTQHETTNKWGNYRINSMSFEIQPILNVTIGNKTLKVSDSHKFLIENGEYVSINNINVGDKIQTIDGLKELVSKENIGNDEVIRFEIEDAHTYVVEGVISHNKAPIDQGLN